MHAEVERSAGAPASLRPDKGWTARLPPAPLERKGLPGAQEQEASLPPSATRGGVVCT